MNTNPVWDDSQLQKALSCGEDTPYYFFDADIFKHNIIELKRLLPETVKICYAMKSNTWLAEHAYGTADYIEICSAGELFIARRMGIPDNVIVADGVCRTRTELKNLAESSLHRIVLESVRQAEIFSSYAQEAGQVKDVLLRISSGNQFGMSRQDIEYIVSRQNKEFSTLKIRGLHAYFGTQKKNRNEIKKNFSLLKDIADSLNLKEIEFGPGLGVVQSPAHDKNIYSGCLEEVCEGFRNLAENHEVIIECGRILCANAGVYVTSVIERKITGGKTFIITDGGNNHLVYDGQPYGFPVPFVVSEHADRSKTETVTICGALCTQADILARDIILHSIEEGSRLVFMSAGAYGVTEGYSLFLSRPLPAVVCGSSVLRTHSETWQLNSKGGSNS